MTINNRLNSFQLQNKKKKIEEKTFLHTDQTASEKTLQQCRTFGIACAPVACDPVACSPLIAAVISNSAARVAIRHAPMSNIRFSIISAISCDTIFTHAFFASNWIVFLRALRVHTGISDVFMPNRGMLAYMFLSFGGEYLSLIHLWPVISLYSYGQICPEDQRRMREKPHSLRQEYDVTKCVRLKTKYKYI